MPQVLLLLLLGIAGLMVRVVTAVKVLPAAQAVQVEHLLQLELLLVVLLTSEVSSDTML